MRSLTRQSLAVLVRRSRRRTLRGWTHKARFNFKKAGCSWPVSAL